MRVDSENLSDITIIAMDSTHSYVVSQITLTVIETLYFGGSFYVPGKQVCFGIGRLPKDATTA